ncbi:MAG: YaaL family protein [Clostridia bacterium]|nr:YaaL family protein [Clostridia bacterium]
MEERYVKESELIKDKSENEKKLELILSVINARKDLENANRNYEFAEGNLIDYYLYEIKANQSKLDYLIKKAKKQGVELDVANSFILKNKKVI